MNMNMNMNFYLDANNNNYNNNKDKNIFQQERNNNELINLKKPTNNILNLNSNLNYNEYREYQNNFNNNNNIKNNNIDNINDIEKDKIKMKFNSKISKEFLNYQNQLRGYNEKKIDDSCKSFGCSNKNQ
jgi:hypothetical protein